MFMGSLWVGSTEKFVYMTQNEDSIFSSEKFQENNQ